MMNELQPSNTGKVPRAPFVGSTQSWSSLVVKRMLRYAAERGYDRLSWDTGATNAARYPDALRQKIDNIAWSTPGSDGVRYVHAKPRDGGKSLVFEVDKDGKILSSSQGNAKGKPIDEVFGKDMAGKIMAERDGDIDSKDFLIGAKGFEDLYDKQIPQFLNKYARKWNSRVEPTRINKGGAPTEEYRGPEPTEDQIAKVWEAICARPTDQRFVSPITGERLHYRINRVSNEQTLRRVEESMKEGKTFTEAMHEDGSPDIAKIFGGEMARTKTAVSEAHVHSVPITESMRESVMQGQPLFEEKQRYETEPGALDARGKPVDQTILPGAEPSAVQLAKAREAAGGGKMGTKVQQKPPGDLFGAQGVPGDDQLSLFEDPQRYSEIPEEDRDALEKAARTGNWIGRFRATGATADDRIRASIAGAYEAWKKIGTAVPQGVREIFKSLGGGGDGRGGPPITFHDMPEGGAPGPGFAVKVRQAADRVFDLGGDLLMHVAPMSQGTPEARAVAKDFANMMRLARWHGNRMMEMLKKNFDHNQLRRMWEAADEESVLRQQGQPTTGRGLSTLDPAERRAVLEQQADAQSVWNAAVSQGMVEGEGLPSYVPRMMVEMAGGEVARLGSSDEARSIPGMGRNVRTSTPQMKQRKHLTTEETEQAGSTKFGTIANVVKDIRTLPMATMGLRQAVAGRALINKIKEIGSRTGDDTVVEGHEPAGTPFKWFTLDNPAFKTWRPKLIKNEETGKYEAAQDQNGNTVFEKVPLYVRGDFEGPLRAVLSDDSSRAYQALMNMKGRAMIAIMYSPLIHNMVEWGRALPTMPGKVFFGVVYFQGNRAKNNPETKTEAIMHGLVPIGHRGASQDITSIANPETIAAGRSWTAKLLGAIPGLFSREAQQSVYRTIDAAGDLWHNTLLWDRVGDLQMGLYVNLRDTLIKHGNDPEAAAYAAAHFANRYAGALPLESMSNTARKLANLIMFSRSFTLGNLGVMKDAFGALFGKPINMVATALGRPDVAKGWGGLPRDVQAQIERMTGAVDMKGVRSMAVRKAISVVMIDLALSYAANSILHSALAYISGRMDGSDIAKGYVDRALALSSRIQDSPIQLFHMLDNMQALSATSENEPERQNRFLVGYDKDGTAIYGRNPVGKIGEEFANWLNSPIQTAISKMSTFLKPTYQVITNDAGFGRHVYNPQAKGYSGMLSNIGKVLELYLSDQVPLASIESAYNMLKGQGSKLDTYKTLGPLAGVTFSKGAAGGPAVGELYTMRREHDAAVSAAMPDIVAKIKAGDVQGARADMRKLGMAPGLINYYVRTTLNPRLRLNTRNSRRIIRNAPPEERARMNELRGVQQ